MANLLINTKQGYRSLHNTSSLLITPYVYSEDVQGYALGSETFDIHAIVGDSISVTQQGGEEGALYNEFRRSPITPLYDDGKVLFSAECLDMQGKLLQLLYRSLNGFVSNGLVEGCHAMDETPKEMYVCIQITFHDENAPRVILPKVYLQNTMDMSKLKSSFATNQIQGKVLPSYLCVLNGNEIVRFGNTNRMSYIPYTRILFAKRDLNFGVYASHDRDFYDMLKVDVDTYETGAILYRVNKQDGTFETIQLM